jgi:hypothetical protein
MSGGSDLELSVRSTLFRMGFGACSAAPVVGATRLARSRQEAARAGNTERTPGPPPI